MKLNTQVRSYWEKEPCGTAEEIVKDAKPLSREWFDRVEEYRYSIEPFILDVADFPKYKGKKILEIGVGAGSDHLQWARAGARCWGVDLTDAAIRTTRKHLAFHQLKSNLRRINAEKLPFKNQTFDAVYSWGVIHHSEKPELIIAEIQRVLKKNGLFIGMLYGRHSVVAFKYWLKHGLFKGRPFRSFRDVLWNHFESIGTKAYTVDEIKELFSRFKQVEAEPILTWHDINKWSRWMRGLIPRKWGWFIAVKAYK
jgi:ubiquinone/menaquinone biosynthesis C-methylase UbiE